MRRLAFRGRFGARVSGRKIAFSWETETHERLGSNAMLLRGKTEYLEGATALVKKGKSMLTKKQLNAWNTADERALQHATLGSPIFDLHFIREWRAAKWRTRSANRDQVHNARRA
jgi:hypothetical protein